MEPANYTVPDFTGFLRELKNYTQKLQEPSSTIKVAQILKFLEDNEVWVSYGINNPHLGLKDLLNPLKAKIIQIKDSREGPLLDKVVNLLMEKLQKIKDTSIDHLSKDDLSEILKKNSEKEIRVATRVTKKFHNAADNVRIKEINDNKTPLKTLFKTADEAVNFLLSSSEKSLIHYLDFEGLPINNEQFEKLIKNCPNITHLNVSLNRLISGDVLKNLQFVPNLSFLKIWGCPGLDKDALKNLEFVPKLRSLDISDCYHFEKDTLKNLRFVPNLDSLVIKDCNVFEIDTLKYLEFVPKLNILDISGCNQLEMYSLKNLEFVPKLTSLIYWGVYMIDITFLETRPTILAEG